MTFHPTGAEISRIIKRKLKAADAEKLNRSLPKPDIRIKEVPSGDADDDSGVNAEYYAAITKFCRAIIKEFPT